MKTIYNVYVPIESQEQADRMKQICIDYGLPIFKLQNVRVLCVRGGDFTTKVK